MEEIPYDSKKDDPVLYENAILLENTPFEILNCTFEGVFDENMKTDIYFQIHKKYTPADYFMELQHITDGSLISTSVGTLLIDNDKGIGKFGVEGKFNIADYSIVLANTSSNEIIYKSKLTSTLHYKQNDLSLPEINDMNITQSTILLEKYLHLPKNRYKKPNAISSAITSTMVKAQSLFEKVGITNAKSEDELGILAVEGTVGDSPDTKMIDVQKENLSKGLYHWDLDMTIDETETIKKLTEYYDGFKTHHKNLAFLISKLNKRIHKTPIGVRLYSVKGIINEFNYLQQNWGITRSTSKRNIMIFDYLQKLNPLLKKLTITAF
jgi:hypothetical protein